MIFPVSDDQTKITRNLVVLVVVVVVVVVAVVGLCSTEQNLHYAVPLLQIKRFHNILNISHAISSPSTVHTTRILLWTPQAR